MISLDSDYIIDFLNGSGDAEEKMKEMIDSNEEIVTTSINTLEIFVGIVEIDGIAGKRVKITRDFLENMKVLEFDSKSSERAAHILKTLEKLGKPIGLKDSLIGGFCLSTMPLF